jgi:hypothetical protein
MVAADNTTRCEVAGAPCPMAAQVTQNLIRLRGYME